MADKSSQMILGALSRAVADPGGLPLLGGRASPGLFPANAAGKLAAQRCQDDGLLRRLEPPPAPDGVRRGRGEAWTISERGLAFLLEQVSPRQVLEDFVRALEARQAQAAELLFVTRQMHQTLDALRARVEQVLPLVPHFRLPERNGDGRPLAALFADFFRAGAADVSERQPAAAPPPADLDDAVVAELQRWRDSGASEDYPLPELFRHLAAARPGLTLGAFHDQLRRLNEAARLSLNPWTGPLYALPEPPFALLVGHAVMYYASPRR